MLLNELNFKALCVSAESVLPVSKTLNVEGKELNFTINEFKSGFGSGKKSVISGIISLNDTNNTSTEMKQSDIEAVRRKVSKLLGLKNTKERKPRAVKESTEVDKLEVDKLRENLAVARRLPREWVKIDAAAVWKAYQEAKKRDAVPNKLEKIKQLDTEKQLKVYELLKNAGLL